MDANSSSKNKNISAGILISLVLFLTVIIGTLRLNNTTDLNTMAARRATPTPGGSGMHITQEAYNNLTNDCLGVDARLDWAVDGTLSPGETYTFTPTKSVCYGETPALTIKANWGSSNVVVSTVAYDNDVFSNDGEQTGRTITGYNVGNTSSLCEFTNGGIYNPPRNYAITIRNTGSSTANNVHVDGIWTNGYSSFYFYRCTNSDADRDGFNDALEYDNSPATSWISSDPPPCCNYLRATGVPSSTQTSYYPPDLNKDGVVDQNDLTVIQSYLGQGNGVSLAEITNNHGYPHSIENQQFPWRHYDLNGDGYVDQADIGTVQSLVNLPIPIPSGVTIPPFSRMEQPVNGSGFSAGSYIMVGAYAVSHQAVQRVEFYANNSLICTEYSPKWPFANGGTPFSPLYNCFWSSPKRRGVTYTMYSKVYDDRGNATTSAPITVSSQ